MLIGELTLAADIGRRLDALGVIWLIGGSVASSLLGEARSISASRGSLPNRYSIIAETPSRKIRNDL